MKKQKTFQAPKGMHDILPDDQRYWHYLLRKTEDLARDYGFEKIDLPLLEQTDLFLRSVGEETDVVEKEMYSLRTKGGDELSLRPEATASVARAYLENGMNVWPQPVKLYYVGPMFRHDEPQAGRYRQFYQLGCETIGDGSEVVDAELIFLASKIIESVGLKDYIVQVNSIGSPSSRATYMKALREFYKHKTKKIPMPLRAKIKANVLRLLDSKDETMQEINKDAPPIVDFLDEDSRRHFKRVLEFLDEVKVPYILNHHLVRGLDYYTKTVFEFVPEDPSANQLAVISGGRYDRLIETIGGPKTPAAGWAMGIDRLVMALKERQVHVPDIGSKPKVFLIQLGDAAKRKSLTLFENLRKSGIPVKSSLGRDSIKSQLRIAHRMGVRYTLIFGQKEAIEGTIIIREMETGIQETVLLDKIVEAVKKKLKD